MGLFSGPPGAGNQPKRKAAIQKGFDNSPAGHLRRALDAEKAAHAITRARLAELTAQRDAHNRDFPDCGKKQRGPSTYSCGGCGIYRVPGPIPCQGCGFVG